MVYRMELTYDEIRDILGVKNIPTKRIPTERIPHHPECMKSLILFTCLNFYHQKW